MSKSKTDTSLYFIAIVAPEPILGEILEMKLDFRDRFNSKHGLKSPAHITLYTPFRSDTKTLIKIEKSLIEIVTKYKPFKISLNNYSHFDNRVIFVDVVNNEEIKELGSDTIETIQEIITNNNKTPFHPHMTLATRDLTPENFNSAWSIYKQKQYNANFNATEISILKHNGKIWEIFKTVSI